MDHDIDAVVRRGMCIGCGACSVATNGAIPVTLGPYRVYQADTRGVSREMARVGSSVCPFSDDSPDEDELGPPSAAGRALPHDSRLGHVGRVLVGRRTDEAELLRSSSGGITSWLLEALLLSGKIDAVVHVGQAEGPELFVEGVSNSSDAANTKRKSIYYATTMTEAMSEVRRSSRRYAIVGVPCYITAARHLAARDTQLNERLTYFVGIVCGHLKSQFFAESLAWQLGVAPDELAEVDFRIKDPSRPANDYMFGARARHESELRTAPTRALFGGNWGIGAFQPEACNFCDDIFAETADIVLGDAWLPGYEQDWRGTNIIVTRNTDLDALLDDGQKSGALELHALSANDAAASQGGNFRHRRDGLAVRLADDVARGLSVPRKRVKPGTQHVSRRRLRLIRQRRRMSAMSLKLFASARAVGDHDVYLRPMRRESRRYRAIERPLWRRVLSRLKRAINKP